MSLTRKEIAAAGYGFLYALSSAGETLAVKSLNYNEVPLQLPTYTALLTNQLWIFMLPIYWLQRKERSSLKETYWSQYLVMGCLTFTIAILRNISVNIMPGSVFSLLISTSILFNIVLSKLTLKKIFTYWHIAAAAFCLASACSIGFAALFTNQEELAGVDYKTGILTAVAAAFFIAVMNVSQEYVQPTWDNYNVRIVEMTIASSLIATILTVVYGTFTKEMTTWDPAITAATQTREGLVLVICISCLLPILKLLVRNTKYATIKNSSAFFFEFAQSSGSLVGSVANVLIFKEPWGIGYIIAIILMTISFVLYAQTKRDVIMPPPPDYPKGDIRISNPIIMTISKQVVVNVSVWK
jgi:drug/metabolite transporter (DMT)-like permease